MPDRAGMLELLGRPRLRAGPGSKPVRVPERLLVLVALLILEFKNEAPRQALASRLWDTSTREQANANLRQLLAKTRIIERRLGIRIVDATDTVISRDSTCVPCDLDRFLVQPGIQTSVSLSAILETYRGDLLDALLEVSAELAAIIEYHRRDLRDRLIGVVLAGAQQLAPIEAERIIRQLQRRVPLDESVCRALMRASAALRGPGDARQVYLEFAEQLHRELGIDPEEATQQVLGELWHAPVSAEASATQSPHRRSANIPDASIAPRLVLLLPQRSTEEVSSHATDLAQSLVSDITTNLCRFRSLAVIAPYSAAQFESRDAIKTISEFGIDYVGATRLKPTGLARGSDLTLEMTLIEASSRRLIWAEEFFFSDDKAVATHRNMAMRIARLLVEAVELREIGIARSCENPTAFGYFLLGRHQLRHLDLPGIRRARKALRTAVELAPSFAQAHGWLARSHLIEWVLRARWETENLTEARRAAELAIERDPMDGIGYRELGRAALFQGDLDEGVHHLHVAVDRSPQHADILADCADTLVHASEIDSAERHIRAAFSLNPLPPEQYHWTAGAISFFKGQYAEALAALDRMDNTEPASRLMAATAAMLGDQKLAAKYRTRTLSVHPDFRVSEWIKVMPQRDPVHREMYETALRRAGFE